MRTIKMQLFGIVQGVGFRPFAAVTAGRYGIRGTVSNKGSYVEIYAQGEAQALAAFQKAIAQEAPERSMILDTEVQTVEDAPEYREFSIIESKREYGNIFVSPDIATCDKCRRELFDPQDRRYLHPFINCTQCGPRLTILDTMPYDRERTSMAEFPMCPECRSEYEDPVTRRYDAQPVCCNACGPQVYLVGTDIRGAEAITAVRRAVMEGKIAAVKGIGGFHLCCDARNTAAVERLRTLKHRPMKPFAVMMRDPETVQRECIVQEGQSEWLTGWQKPILLLEKQPGCTLSAKIAPDMDTVGVMLPYAPVQMLLFDYPDGIAMTDCLVMTSGNARGAPICRNDADAVKEIGGFCDLILSHDRKIRIRADDSVCDWLDGAPYMIRRSRGFAPLPVMLKADSPRQALGIGGELKNSFCIARGGLLYASPYVGDMADIRTVAALRESVDRLCGLLEAKPEVIACDTHPLYNTVTVAQELAAQRDIPLVQVQHHYAHILSCMAENGCTDRVIGVSMDGTGYGDDGTIWGGELLISDFSGYERRGSIAPFLQIGGDASSKEGWRIAVSILRDMLGDAAEDACVKLGLCDAQNFGVQRAMAQRHINAVASTSCGRLFDAASAVLGIRTASTFEGEAATALMTQAERYAKRNGIPAPERIPVMERGGFVTLPTAKLLSRVAEEMLAHPEAQEALACQFHAALAQQITESVCILREQTGIQTAALSGGVFQNRLLTRLCEDMLGAQGITVLRHHLIPPNDGGIAVGQAAYAAMHI